ncbi:Nif11-like leader peptide family natural product precursor [Synechococcus sp. W4D4]|uniref:Nif11-like leader peptide family natural product precursor n=1 Tax=Synechococcus sp. W4D4 TaxID=3392294 RepID=UPI0039E78126
MAEQLPSLFGFLALIQDNPELRARLNEVCTADEVAAIATEMGHPFEAATLLGVFERCNEASVARSGLMDEKLIRVYLQRDALL